LDLEALKGLVEMDASSEKHLKVHKIKHQVDASKEEEVTLAELSSCQDAPL
jgi:hypothetical protein